jgi:3',5'-cyclic AMP phosphodiesterase CpdA
MRLVHISDIHIYDPSSTALQKARKWGKLAIIGAAMAGIVGSGRTSWGKQFLESYPRLFRTVQGLAIAGLSAYLVRQLIDHGHHRAYRSLESLDTRRILFEELQSMSFDHLLVTGDIALTPSQAEFERARELFEPFWDRLHLIPGNHDVPFITGSSGDFEKTFAERLDPFPFVRDLGEGVVLSGLDTTVRGMLQDPWAALSNARGRITHEQMIAIRRRMPDAGTRLMAMHHHLRPNPAGPGGLVKRIYMGPVHGHQYLLDNMRRLGVDLVLHGHQHWNYFGRGFLCAGTSTLRPDGGSEYPAYNIYDFDGGELVEVRKVEIRGEKLVEESIPVRDVLPVKK